MVSKPVLNQIGGETSRHHPEEHGAGGVLEAGDKAAVVVVVVVVVVVPSILFIVFIVFFFFCYSDPAVVLRVKNGIDNKRFFVRKEEDCPAAF